MPFEEQPKILHHSISATFGESIDFLHLKTLGENEFGVNLEFEQAVCFRRAEAATHMATCCICGNPCGVFY